MRDWIADRDAQRSTQAAIDAFATAWNAGPAHRAIAAAMAELEAPNAATVAAAARRLLEDDSRLDALVAGLAAAGRDDPFFEPPFRYLGGDIHCGLLVYEDEYLSIAAGVTPVTDLAARKQARRGGGSIAFSGQLNVIKFVKAGSARLSFWEAAPIGDGFTAAAAGRCRKVGERDAGDGEIILLDGRCESFIIEHARSNLLIVQATVKPEQAPVSVEYDSETGEYVGCAAADDSASRIQMIATLLRKLDCAAAFPAIAAFLDHPHFFVRWHVMRELVGIDAAAALPHLKRMAARDPHPETRRAARLALDRIETPQPKRKAA